MFDFADARAPALGPAGLTRILRFGPRAHLPGHSLSDWVVLIGADLHDVAVGDHDEVGGARVLADEKIGARFADQLMQFGPSASLSM
jgi:hypothetical protein